MAVRAIHWWADLIEVLKQKLPGRIVYGKKAKINKRSSTRYYGLPVVSS